MAATKTKIDTDNPGHRAGVFLLEDVMAAWLKRLLGKGGVRDQDSGLSSPDTPTSREWQQACDTLAASGRDQLALRLGGARPPATRAASWWGGNFIAPPPRDGVLPLFQLRIADLPAPYRAPFHADYLLAWLGPNMFAEDALVLVERNAPADLPPVEANHQAGSLPILPLFPGLSGRALPTWEDFSAVNAAPVAQAQDSDWFFDADRFDPPQDHPILLGGHPQWIQGSQWPTGAEFVAEVRSTGKGGVSLGDGGSFYLFRRAGEWLVRADCF